MARRQTWATTPAIWRRSSRLIPARTSASLRPVSSDLAAQRAMSAASATSQTHSPRCMPRTLRIDRIALTQWGNHGLFGLAQAKLARLGDVEWGRLFSALTSGDVASRWALAHGPIWSSPSCVTKPTGWCERAMYRASAPLCPHGFSSKSAGPIRNLEAGCAERPSPNSSAQLKQMQGGCLFSAFRPNDVYITWICLFWALFCQPELALKDGLAGKNTPRLSSIASTGSSTRASFNFDDTGTAPLSVPRLGYGSGGGHGFWAAGWVCSAVPGLHFSFARVCLRAATVRERLSVTHPTINTLK